MLRRKSYESIAEEELRLRDRLFLLENNEMSQMVKRKSTDGNKDTEKPNEYPKSAFFVLGNEFSERFSFFGMRALLVLYFINIHHMSESSAKSVYHLFVTISYFTPLVGSALADGLLGKYRVILYFSVLYVFGHCMMTVGAFFDAEWAAGDTVLKVCDFAGLILIALANGGLKPCVSAFAGDQFAPESSHLRKQFFSYFYSSVNYGAFLGFVLTPILYAKVSCLGRDSCYPLAFGVPAVFMLLAFVLFLSGTKYYKQVQQENIIWSVIRCIGHAFWFKVRHPKQDWSENADGRFERNLVVDVKGLLKLLVIFVPVIPFFALLDQQGSTWTLQANKMNGRVGPLSILPSQMLMLNPLLVISLVPIFETVIYPFLGRHNCLVKPLRRMGWGGFMIASSFVLASIVQVSIDKTYTGPPSEAQTFYYVRNDAPCDVNISSKMKDDYVTVKSNEYFSGNLHQEIDAYLIDCRFSKFHYKLSPATFGEKGAFVQFVGDSIFVSRFNLTRTTRGRSYIFIDSRKAILAPIIAKVMDDSGSILTWTTASAAITMPVNPPIWNRKGRYSFIVEQCANSTVNCSRVFQAPYELLSGETHILTARAQTNGADEGGELFDFVSIIPGNSVSMMWQLPQFVLITVGEIMFCITGLEFSYSQASPRLKSVVLALWYVSNAFGDMVPTLISFGEMFRDPAYEFVMYAALVYIATALFALVAMNYEYIAVAAADHDKSKVDAKDQHANKEYAVSTL